MGIVVDEARLIEGSTDNALYFFASFDICNFTRIKEFLATRGFLWPVVIEKAWETIMTSVFARDFWKFNGDEFLFRIKVFSLVDIMGAVQKAYGLASSLGVQLEDILVNEFGDDFKDQLNAARKDEKMDERVRIKAGAWLANVTRFAKKAKVGNKNIDNYEFANEFVHNSDFVGVSIDRGFRMCSCSSPGRLVVDPVIAYMFHSYANGFTPGVCEHHKFVGELEGDVSEEELIKFSKNFVLVGQAVLKGVWREKPYPIIWFSDNNWKIDIRRKTKSEEYEVEVGGDGRPNNKTHNLGNYFVQSKNESIANLQKILTLTRKDHPLEENPPLRPKKDRGKGRR